MLRVQDDSGCDLDPSYQVFDVFEERAIARVIILDDGTAPKRLFSPAAMNLMRRGSFDSETGYVTPSVSSVNASSPLNTRLVRMESEDGVINAVDNLVTPSNGEDQSKSELKNPSRSPELLPPRASPTRKRKRLDDAEIPPSPEKPNVVKRRVTATKKTDKTTERPMIIEVDVTRIPETPEKDRPQKVQTALDSSKEIPEDGTEEADNKMQGVEVEQSEPAPQISQKSPIRTRKRAAQITKESKAPEMVPATAPEDASPAVPPVQPEAKKPVKRQPRTKKAVPPAPEEKEISTPRVTASSKPTTGRALRQPLKSSPPQLKPPVNPVQPAKPSDSTLAKNIRRTAASIREVKKEQLAISKDESSPTSQSAESVVKSSGEEARTSNSSANDDDEESDEKSEESDEQSEESDSDSDSDSDSGDKMDVDDEDESEEPQVTSSRKKPVPKAKPLAVANKNKSLPKLEPSRKVESKASTASDSAEESDFNSASESEKSGSEESESESGSESGSGSGSGSRSGSGSGSGSEESDSENSASESEEGSGSESESRQESESESENEDESESDKSHVGSVHETSSTSSQAVAAQLGGQVSGNKSISVDPIIHRISLSQNTDVSPNKGTLSQQSPLAKLEGQKLQRWNSLSDIAKKYKKEKQQTSEVTPQTAQEEIEEEEDEESESDDSSDEDSDKEKVVNGVPKSKLAGRTPVSGKRKSGGLRAMFK